MSDKEASKESAKSKRLVQLSRLVRTSGDMQLSEEKRTLLKSHLKSEIERLQHDKYADQPQEKARQYELKIRQMVAADARWDQMGPVCWQYFHLQNDAEVAGRLIELCFLYGNEAQLRNVIERLLKEQVDFYKTINVAVRSQLLGYYWQRSVVALISPILEEFQELSWLIPIEKLHIFLKLSKSDEAADAYSYYSRHRKDINRAVLEHKDVTKVTQSSINFLVARLLIKIGKKLEARTYLEQITATDPEYQSALRLLLSFDSDRKDLEKGTYHHKLKSEGRWEKRIKLFKNYLATTERLGGIKDKNRGHLNLLLENPRRFLPDLPEAWSRLSNMLVANLKLTGLLPNLLKTFSDNILKFHEPDLDMALWQAWLREGQKFDLPYNYYVGVGMLHQYVASGGRNSAALWRAREIIEEIDCDGLDLPNWRTIHRSATAFLQDAMHFEDEDKNRLLIELAVAADSQDVTLLDIEYYIKRTFRPPPKILDLLQDTVRKKKAYDLEEQLIIKVSRESHLRNFDLDRLWHLACAKTNNDLAWRVATLLYKRMSLVPQVEYAWQISGENRRGYPLFQPHKADLDLCFKDFEDHERRLANACLQGGPAMAELLAILDQGAKPLRTKVAADSFEGQLEQLLHRCLWLSSSYRKFQYSERSIATHQSLPFFAQLVPHNEWSFVVSQLIDRMSLYAWNWDFHRLGQRIKELLPDMGGRDRIRKLPKPVVKWLKSLNPQQRSAWNDLTICAARPDNSHWGMVLSRMICRLATLIYPHHIQALTTLQKMQAPLWLIWDLERWIVSPEYSELRQSYKIASRVLVPASIQKMPSIVLEKHQES